MDAVAGGVECFVRTGDAARCELGGLAAAQANNVLGAAGDAAADAGAAVVGVDAGGVLATLRFLPKYRDLFRQVLALAELAQSFPAPDAPPTEREAATAAAADATVHAVDALEGALRAGPPGAWPHLLQAAIPLLISPDLHNDDGRPLFSRRVLMLLLGRLEQLCLSHRAKEVVPQALSPARLLRLRQALAAKLGVAFVADNRAAASKAAGPAVEDAMFGVSGQPDHRYRTLRPTAEELLEPAPLSLAFA